MRIGLGLAIALALLLSAAEAQESITYASADGTPVRARLFLPSGAGPFPAIVALHGCGGPNDSRGGLSRRHRDWAERWVGQGYAVLFPDSFGSRGFGSLCNTRDREVRPGRERAADVAGARTYLQARRDIRADAISLVGWSNGGSTVLHAIRPEARANDGRPDFARAVAFYPGCRLPAQRGATARLPLLLLIGEADNWTPPEPCRAYAAQAGRVQLVTYPSAVHGFDDPASRLRERSGLGFTADGSGRARVGTDPQARADAIGRVTAFLGN
jgi:dienelactone hydrolase